MRTVRPGQNCVVFVPIQTVSLAVSECTHFSLPTGVQCIGQDCTLQWSRCKRYAHWGLRLAQGELASRETLMHAFPELEYLVPAENPRFGRELYS